MPNGGPGDPFYEKIMREERRKMRKKSYLIEFRFSGFAKKSIRELKQNITKNFGVTRKKIVPHITIVGPLHTWDEKLLVQTVKDVCKKYDKVTFKLDGFDNFQNRVIYLKIKPSKELTELRKEIVEKLEKQNIILAVRKIRKFLRIFRI